MELHCLQEEEAFRKMIILLILVIGGFAYFNQRLIRSILFSDFLEIFRQVYCPLQF